MFVFVVSVKSNNMTCLGSIPTPRVTWPPDNCPDRPASWRNVWRAAGAAWMFFADPAGRERSAPHVWCKQETSMTATSPYITRADEQEPYSPANHSGTKNYRL